MNQVCRKITVKNFAKAVCILILIEFVFYVARLSTSSSYLSSRRNHEQDANVKNITAATRKPDKAEASKANTKVDLFIAILSAPQRVDRRHAMRETWLSTIPYYSVGFRFFTDGIELSNKTKTLLSEEQKKFGDLELLPTKGGYWFSHRFLHALFWAD